MPFFDETTREKITLLRGLRALGTSLEVYELIKIEWPAPDGTIYYASLQVDEVASVAPPISPIVTRRVPEELGRPFVSVQLDSSIGDEELELEFWDQDDLISNLVNDHGEGVKVTLLYWFPQVELLLPQWEGHLRFEDEADADTIQLKAVQGFRSSEADVPGRAHYSHCQAIFGGLLDTQEEIDEQGCPYNLHIGGAIGTNDPDTGLPWTFCDRRTPSSCTVRGVNPLRHLSHQTMVTTIVNPQSSGPRLLSTSAGNETNLTEPVRVVMGTRRIYGMPNMVFRRDLNTNTPDHGWFQGFYEGGEGPVASITQARITVGGVTQNAVPLHYGFRLGNFGDVSPDINLTPHGYSATWFIRYAFGWVDPSGIDPEDASASAVTTGLRDVRVYGGVNEGQNGLLVTYFSDYDFTTVFGARVEPWINYPVAQSSPPIEGLPQSNWSSRSIGLVQPRYTENYTFKITHDDGVRVWVDNTLIIDQFAALGTHTGTISLVADQLYDIRVDFKQGVSVWYNILKWSSASQTEEVIPTARLFVAADDDATYVKSTTRNRVWQIARILTDKRWGHGHDYEKLNIDSWIEAAQYVEESVRFTDINGTNWDHQRGMSDVELIARKVQQQVDDMCLSGRLSRPFLFDGELHIMPLRALTEDELAECPEFTDEGDAPNIIKDEQEEGVFKSSLTWSRKSDLDLPNRIECTADLASEDYLKTPLQPVEDIDAQLRAGRVIGDKSRKINKKTYHLLGVTDEGHGMKMAWSLLDLGEHDEGGLQNNLRVRFSIWWADAVDLHMAKVIKVTSSRIAKYGFTHFRILKLDKEDSLHYKVEAQAYNHEYLEALEVLLETPVTDPTAPEAAPPQCILQFGTVTYDGTVLDIPVPACVVVDDIDNPIFLGDSILFGGDALAFNP